MISLIAVTRTSVGSVTMSEPEQSTRNRILTGNTALAGGDAQTSPWISSSSSTVMTGGGTFSSGVCAQEAVAAAATAIAAREPIATQRRNGVKVAATPGR